VSALAVEQRLPPALPGAYADPPSADALEPHPATVALVRGVVRDLLADNPNFRALDAEERVAFARNLVSVGSYLAECVRDDWYQSGRLQQRPVVRTRQPVATAQTAADDFRPAAASQIGRVTTETLRAVAFPVFVADLIKGTFNAISDASQKQMDAYMQLLEGVGKTVDDFMNDRISDDEARRWLVDKYPHHIAYDANGTSLVPAKGAPEKGPDFTAELNLSESVSADDASQLEDTLVPAARRKLAQSRLQLLSALVLMGINRIVVTGGKIRATMGFHINTRDTAHAESASQFQFGSSVSGSFGYGPWSASASVSVAYVSSSRADSNAEINTQTDLTGEVEIHFQSDYFPIERFASADGIDKIRANTPVPATNVPVTPVIRDTVPWGDTSPPRPVEGLGPVRQPAQNPFAAIPDSPVKAPPLQPSPDDQERQRKQQAGAPKPDAAKKPETPAGAPQADAAKKPETPTGAPQADAAKKPDAPATPAPDAAKKTETPPEKPPAPAAAKTPPAPAPAGKS
jgi:hypothetical protein